MSESDLPAGSSNPEDSARGEIQDAFYHDDDDIVDINDVDGFRRNPVPKKKAVRRPPPPRRFIDD